MFAAQMQKSADKAVPAVSVIITAARPVVVIGKTLPRLSSHNEIFCRLKPSSRRAPGTSPFQQHPVVQDRLSRYSKDHEYPTVGIFFPEVAPEVAPNIGPV